MSLANPWVRAAPGTTLPVTSTNANKITLRDQDSTNIQLWGIFKFGTNNPSWENLDWNQSIFTRLSKGDDLERLTPVWEISNMSVSGEDAYKLYLASDTSSLTSYILKGDDNINGSSFSDTLFGYSGNDRIFGDNGNDKIDGGAGVDAMAGGLGNDTYVVDNTKDTIKEAVDAGADTVQSSVNYVLSRNLENLILTGNSNINGTGNGLSNTLTGNSGSNILDGGAGGDAMAGGFGNDTYVVDDIGDTVTEAVDAGADTVQSRIQYKLGNNLENLILIGTFNIHGTGNALNNTLAGNSGSNILDGGAGADAMAGGFGNDTYVVDNIGDTITESTNAGTDTVQSDIAYTLGNNLENLILTGTSNINGTGNALSNTLAGNSGNNTLDGGTGTDAMEGGLGNDTYVVDNTGDIVTEAVDAGTDTVQSNVSYTLGNNLENLILTGTANIANINGTGNALNNTLTGNSGSNILDGGAGADAMEGGQGDDHYFVDNISDIVIENTSEGNDTITSTVNYTLGANQERLYLAGSGSINGTGNGFDNFLRGNGSNNILSGGAGADTMAGGRGDDTYVVDNIADNVVENKFEGINDIIMSSVNYTLSANVENLTLTGADNINGTGNSLNNTISGNSGNNILDGGRGKDILNGGGGADIFRYSTLGNSRLAEYDRINDFAVGIDVIDGANAVVSTNIRKLGAVASLSENEIQKVLSSGDFVSNGAAIFTFKSGGSTQTYLALNDSTAGFSERDDAIIEITGYSGNINDLSVV